jgi:cytoplasmic iron level regulating protein YaaA (DUF328/UPF0246 family)
MKVIISPAKSIEYKPINNEGNFSIPHFLKEAEGLAKKLKKVSSKKLGEMMHISSDLSDLNFQRYQSWESPDDKKDSNFPCIAGFNGEAFKGLNAWSMDNELLLKTNEKLRVLSGLYGVLKPLDVIYPYRLEMGTKWQINPSTKGLYSFWGTKIADFLNKDLSENEVLINLASTEYFKAVDLKKLKSKVITPIFKDFKNGKFKVIMMYAKHQRGAMARYIIENDLRSPEELKLYNGDGYSFDVKASTEKEWVFVR